MSKIYMIAEEVWIPDEGRNYDTETRVCHNFGAFHLECDAQRKCDALNAKETEEDPTMEEGPYYVKEIDVR